MARAALIGGMCAANPALCTLYLPPLIHELERALGRGEGDALALHSFWERFMRMLDDARAQSAADRTITVSIEKSI